MKTLLLISLLPLIVYIQLLQGKKYQSTKTDSVTFHSRITIIHGIATFPYPGKLENTGDALNIENNNLSNSCDSLINPLSNSCDSTGVKVVISNGKEGLEFTPLSSVNNGTLIQSINRIANKGISTAFFLKDTANWSFFTNSKQRLRINGDGKIIAHSSILVNNFEGDKFALSVKGNSIFDSSLIVQSFTDNSSFISLNSNINSAAFIADDGISPYTTTPTSWAKGKNIPAFRIRHSNTVTENQLGINTSLQRDFMILPYDYGTAIEYNGVVECWVGEWQIHRGLHYNDVKKKGNGWGGVLWVGDDDDGGGVRATAIDNTMNGGNVKYGELSVEKFTETSHGDFRFRLPSTTDVFQFVQGERGSKNIIAKISEQGLVIPKSRSVAARSTSEKAEITYDSTDNQFKGHNGSEWVKLGNDIFTGSFECAGDGVIKDSTIKHGLSKAPSYFNVTPTSAESANRFYITTDESNIIIHFIDPPKAGSKNLSWNWEIKK